MLVDISTVPGLLSAHALDVTVATGFGNEVLPEGLHTVVGRKDDTS